MRILGVLLSTAFAFGASASAQAAITVYTDEAAFLAAVSTPGVDTFEDFEIFGPTDSPITRTAGTYGYTAAVSTTSFFGAGSPADRWLSTNTATDTVTFDSFTGGVAAFGGLFFGSDIAGAFQLGDITLTATDADGTVTETIISATTSSFLGFVSSTGSLSSATLASVQPSTGFIWPTANNLTLASTAAIPEPATWAMMIGGFSLVGAAARRRVRSSVTYA